MRNDIQTSAVTFFWWPCEHFVHEWCIGTDQKLRGSPWQRQSVDFFEADLYGPVHAMGGRANPNDTQVVSTYSSLSKIVSMMMNDHCFFLWVLQLRFLLTLKYLTFPKKYPKQVLKIRCTTSTKKAWWAYDTIVHEYIFASRRCGCGSLGRWKPIPQESLQRIRKNILVPLPVPALSSLSPLWRCQRVRHHGEYWGVSPTPRERDRVSKETARTDQRKEGRRADQICKLYKCHKCNFCSESVL